MLAFVVPFSVSVLLLHVMAYTDVDFRTLTFKRTIGNINFYSYLKTILTLTLLTFNQAHSVTRLHTRSLARTLSGSLTHSLTHSGSFLSFCLSSYFYSFFRSNIHINYVFTSGWQEEVLHHLHHVTYIAQTQLTSNNLRQKLGHACNI